MGSARLKQIDRVWLYYRTGATFLVSPRRSGIGAVHGVDVYGVDTAQYRGALSVGESPGSGGIAFIDPMGGLCTRVPSTPPRSRFGTAE
jgi:hypothetical protein